MASLLSHLWRRSQPQPPEPVDDAARLNAAPADQRFVTGNGIASWCEYVLNYGPPYRNEHGHAGWYFCRTNYLDWFFEHEASRTPFVLFTHNSDWPVGTMHVRHLRRRGLIAWFASNVDLDHPKLRPLPLGIANPHWPHGSTDEIRRVQRLELPKSIILDASFSVGTNAAERNYCLEQTRVALMPPLPFAGYLDRLARSYFALSPSGHGVDVHRTWEALYLRTIPIVTRSRLTDAWGDLPMVVLDDWQEFTRLDLSPELYESIWNGWDSSALSLAAVRTRVELLLAGTG